MSPKTMKITAKALLWLVAAFMLANGLRLMFDPSGALEGLLVNANNLEGISHVRALWGGAITAIGISVVFAAVTGDINNARPAVLFTFARIIGRVTGMVLDGMYDKVILFTIVPVVVFFVLLVAHKLLDRAAEA